MRALIASGSGRYADPWHPFSATSPLIAQILTDAGLDVSIDHDVDRAMVALDGVDLLVVNAGDPWRSTDRPAEPPQESVDGFAAALARGMGVLALHCAVSSLRDYPEWYPAIGAMWVPELSFHPDASLTTIRGEVAAHEVPGLDVSAFDVYDERYCRLQRLGRSTIVATHEGRDATDPREPTAWVRELDGARVAVDVLGHDERSYESAGHRRLLASLALWAARA